MIDPELERWLRANGYEHYVFVSYPRVPDAAATHCARSVAKAVRQRFADFTATPSCKRVFVDDECIQKGEVWEPLLEGALCRSVLMVAVCAPIYYLPEHKWCGREYQAMLSLSQIRRTSGIFPMVVRKFPDYPLPNAVSRLQFVDLVDETTRYSSFTNRKKFQTAIDEIMDRIETVAKTLRANNAAAEPRPGKFEFPQDSAFEDYNSPNQSAPLRSS